MISSRLWVAILCLSPSVLLTWGGCASSPPVNESSSARVPEAAEDLFPPGNLLVAPGTVDLGNIHLPSVMVSASIINEKGRMARKSCSGVLVHPRLVLTAGHCICAPRSPTEADRVAPLSGTKATGPTRADPARKRVVTRASALKNVSIMSIVDGKSSCAKTATVTTVQYTSMKPGTPSEPEIHDYTGEVVVHPALELISGQSGPSQGVVWSNADLAAIFLKEPLAATMPRLKLTEAEVQEGDAVTMVGYSSGSDVSPIYGARHFGANRVSRLIHLESGGAVFRTEDQQLPGGGAASHTQGGDSGGACVKESDKDVLIGITTVGAKRLAGGPMSIFTSVYSHRSWLLQMLAQAGKS